MQNATIYRILSFICILFIASLTYAGDGGGIVATATLDGSKHQVQTDSSRTVEDSAFFSGGGTGVLDTGYAVQNVVTVKINEASPLYMRSAFSVTVQLRIIYSNGTSVDSVANRDFTVTYDSAHPYNARNSFVFYGGRRVTVKVLSVSKTVSWDVSQVLIVENKLIAKPKFVFTCSNTVSNITVTPSTDPAADELPVTWTTVRGADQYDVEWAYIDASALANHKYGDPLNPAQVFLHNATRITTTSTSYNIPLIYDNDGTLFIRVRAVQTGAANSVITGTWSSDASPSVMGQYVFTGHERPLNWQSNISFAEEGKRKVVVQYFDGSLRSRQTVTKDNTTNKTIVAETFYDYQGRPAIQVMPAPSLKNIIQYTAGFNVSINHAEYSQGNYDTLLSPDLYCSAHAAPMSSDSGSGRYYSPNNPNKTIGMNQFVPDAKNYPFTETEYTQDNTGRISRQSGVGPDHLLGSGRETKYFYGTPDQKEIDALFGTDVGDHSHYFKNMVRDANGQYSVSYVDMHGRTIATALAGNAPTGMTALPSNVQTMITENLADSGTRFLQNWSMVSQKSIVVPMADSFIFNYNLDPASLTEKGCDSQNICYTCLYDLEINITDNCNNQLLPGAKAFDTVLHNFSLAAMPRTCEPSPMNLRFGLFLQEGSYQVTKTLTISHDAYSFYRDSVYLPNNTCKSAQDFINEQKALIAASTTSCVPDCQACRTSVGTLDHFRNDFITKAGIPASDTAAYSTQIVTAYNNALAACDALCGDSASDGNDIRQAMLQDMTPPYGQYADTSKGIHEDIYSIFYIDPKDTLNYVPVYRLDGVQYNDENGMPDSVFNMTFNMMVEPNSLGMSDFVQYFRSSWAEALLPYHPEYCKLKVLESLKTSSAWDRQLEAVDNYRDALDSGYLNPTGLIKYQLQFPIKSTDPIFQKYPDFKSRLEGKLENYIKFGDGTSLTMWGMANVMVKCDNANSACLKYYATISRNFDATAMCEGDLNQAWQNFRQLYLTFKQDLVNEKIKDPKDCTPLNRAYSTVPKYSDLIKSHTPEFSETIQSTVSNSEIGYVANDKTGAQTQQKLNEFYDDNCKTLVDQWASQLSPCAYSADAWEGTIKPLLLGLCRSACDASHPFGASTLPAGRDFQGYTSFEDIISKYNKAHNITNELACNAQLITAPAPYDKQPVYYNKPVYTKPADCECTLINEFHTRYVITRPRKDVSFSAWLKRTQGVNMSDANLNLLLELCNNNKTPTDAGLPCVFLAQPVYLPPALQCNSGEVCTSCTAIDTLYRNYLLLYPGDTPRIADMSDTIQASRNTLFKNYMNNHLGYSLETWQYLQFMQQCRDSAGHISNYTQCVDGHIGNLYTYAFPGKLEDIQVTAGNGYIITGHTGETTTDGVLIKTDSTGNIQWSMKYGGGGNDSLVRVRPTSDNGYIAIGTTRSGHYGTGAIWIIKTNAGGNVIWSKTIGLNTPHGEHGYDIIQTSDGGYAALGIYNQHGGNGEFVLTSLQSNGAINWVRRFGTSRMQISSGDCVPSQPDSVNYDGKPAYGLLQQDDTLLVTGAAYDRNLGDRYYGVVYRVNKNDGSLLGSWHYADNTDNTKSCWFRDIYATANGYMIMAGNADKLGTGNEQVAVVNLSTAGDVLSYRRFNVPGGSSKMTTAAVFPASDGGYIIAQTGNNGDHIVWQRMGAEGALLWSAETAIPGTQTIGRLVQNNDSSFTVVGDNNRQMMMLVLRPNSSCYDNTISLGTSTPSLGRMAWAIESQQFASPLYTDTTFSTVAIVLKDSVITCPGSGQCFNMYDGPLLCGKSQPLLPPVDIEYIGACTDSTFFSVSKGTELNKVYKDSLTGAFEQNYINKCLQAYRYESFTVTHPKREYHYTLYYYDQAGNLIRTVPPAGVHEFTDTTVLKQVAAARDAGTVLVPVHTLVTDYRYNTLNQVVAQHTPDGGTSHFWYDRLGRLSISQNAKQALLSPTGGAGGGQGYSYTKYDEIGRITEVGQIFSNTSMTDAISRKQSDLQQWLSNAAATAEQITRTVYDEEYWAINGLELTAKHLRNRVAYTQLFNTAADLGNNTAATATYYSYDILGNVDTLVQDYRFGAMGGENRFKKMVYDYDLVSGKVNQVSYQPGQVDAFYHRYLYDAENRITNVLTSRDSINWDNDAYYQYYDHGPLARTILGEQQVQGINYAYTLHGWLKGINPDVYNGTGYTLKADGGTGSVVGKPAYHVMLNYYNGDYKAISSATPMDDGVDAKLGHDGYYRPLYNGNISSMAVDIKSLSNPLLYSYQYDQLNRLVAMDAWQKTDSAWKDITRKEDFAERVSYDANGNILRYKRNGNASFAGKPLGMDSLTYHYITGTNQLGYVSDSVPASNYDVDIDNQDTANYKYDAIGNLVKDSSEKITNISWTVYGKISHISKSDGTEISYTYDASGNRISKVVNRTSPRTNETTWYVRDAQGNVMSVYLAGKDSVNQGHLSQTEVHLYGSSRLGILQTSTDVAIDPPGIDTTMPLLGKGYKYIFERGNKLFELSNHLGNVLVTISDKKLGYSSNDSTVDYFNPQVVSAQDYYPFGMMMMGRSYLPSTGGAGGGRYRYGFNGKENDNEVKGEGEQINFEARVYDPRIGRWASVDPLQKKYPHECPYMFTGNNPVLYVDKDGKDKIITVTTINRDGSIMIIERTDHRYFDYQMDALYSGGYTYSKRDIHINIVIDQRESAMGKNATTVETTYGIPKNITGWQYTLGNAKNWTAGLKGWTDGIYGDRSKEIIEDRWVILGKGGDFQWQNGLPKAGEGSEAIDLTTWLEFVGTFRSGQKFSDLAKDGSSNKKIQAFIKAVEKYTKLIEKGDKGMPDIKKGDNDSKKQPAGLPNQSDEAPKKSVIIYDTIYNKYGNQQNLPWRMGQGRTVETGYDSAGQDGKTYQVRKVYKKQ